MVAVADRPWRQLPGAFGAAPGFAASAFGDPGAKADAYAVDAQAADTVFETADAGFVVENPAAQPGRACAKAFAPEPRSVQQQQQMPTSATFRPCPQGAHVALRRAAAEAPLPAPGLLRELSRRGRIGAALAALLSQTNTEGWALIESWFIGIFVAIWQFLMTLLFGSSQASNDSPVVAVPAMSWHPHRDLLASISARGDVAVHALGDPFVGPTTQYLHDDGAAGQALALAWQPNDLRGTLALGLSEGVALWRRSRSDGWCCVWNVRGAPYASCAITWAPDGRSLASGSFGGVVRVWLHSDLCTQRSGSRCILLRRWRSGRVAALQWGPDGAFLAAAHDQRGRSPMLIRVWDTRSWEIAAHVDLGVAAASWPSASLDWCSGDTLLATHSADTARGCLFEFSNLSARGAGWAANSEPISRALPLPLVRCADGSSNLPDCPAAVLQVAVCPRTAQRIAVRLEGVPHVLVFERLGTNGWAKQELSFRGLISATTQAFGASAAPADGTPSAALPRAVAFAAAGRGSGGSSARASAGAGAASCGAGSCSGLPEASLLAVYWDFEGGSEIRTYPMHYLSNRLLQKDASLLFS